ncbi:MAG: adenine phosphoribosyltransferase [Phycisphaerae bacterium]|nr:adenine phosphoribosyltransferase [Phycisphaerae bacterium]
MLLGSPFAAGLLHQLDALIRDVPDFPKPGIVFKDITPMLADPSGLGLAVELMANPFRKAKIDLVCGAESRGFIFGTAIAQTLGAGFIPIRKPGKLPSLRIRAEYALEYGSDTLEVHADAVHPGQRVLMVDDLLATGGTMSASCRLLSDLKAEIVGVAVLIELTALLGRARLAPFSVHSVLTY